MRLKTTHDLTMSKYGVVIIDEAHQHTIATDILLGVLKDLLTKRADLKVLIMSATLDVALFRKYFPGSKVETVTGQPYQVTKHYLSEPTNNLPAEIVNTIMFIALTQSHKPGNILVFVSGVREINEVISGVKKALASNGRFRSDDLDPLQCYSLHRKLSIEDQQLAVNAPRPGPKNGRSGRKVIVSTNIAETSITINGVTHVIDSGRAKSRIWDSRDQTFAMYEHPISQADVVQRIGRAGRQSDGDAWLMYTERGYKEDLMAQSWPEIMKCDMLSESLIILGMGYSPLDFDYIFPPATETVVRALGILTKLDAIDLSGALLQRGRDLNQIPVDVYSALTVQESTRFGCSDEVLSIIAMINATQEGNDVYLRAVDKDEQTKLRKTRGHFGDHTGDHLTLFNIFMAWRSARIDNTTEAFFDQWMLNEGVLKAAEQTRLDLLRTMRRYSWWTLSCLDRNSPNYHSTILRALAAGNFLRVAKHVPGGKVDSYQQIGDGTNVTLWSDTHLRPSAEIGDWVFYNECFNHREHGRCIRTISAIKPELLFTAKPKAWWDAQDRPSGHIQNAIVAELAKLSKQPKEKIIGGFPAAPSVAPVPVAEPATKSGP